MVDIVNICLATYAEIELFKESEEEDLGTTLAFSRITMGSTTTLAPQQLPYSGLPYHVSPVPIPVTTFPAAGQLTPQPDVRLPVPADRQEGRGPLPRHLHLCGHNSSDGHHQCNPSPQPTLPSTP